MAGRTRPQRRHRSRLLRQRRRLPDEIALTKIDAEVRQHREVGATLDPFGQEQCTDPPTERDERLDEGLLRVVPSDPEGDLAIDLDHRRTKSGNQAEARVAGAGVVDREAEPEPAERLDLPDERPDVRDGLLLSALQRDVLRLESRAPDHRAERPGFEAEFQEAR